MSVKKTIQKELHELVEAVEDFLEKQEKADNYRNSNARHDAVIAKRKVKTLIAKYRLTSPKTIKPKPQQGGFNFLAL
jgi:hypothetical protein